MSAADPLAPPTLAYFADLSVEVGKPEVLSRGPRGMRRVVPITGGRARGEGWTARVLPGGSDFQLIPARRCPSWMPATAWRPTPAT